MEKLAVDKNAMGGIIKLSKVRDGQKRLKEKGSDEYATV